MTISNTAVKDPTQASWERIRGRLRAQHGEAAFKSWLKPLEVSGVRGGKVMISVPTRFMRDWVATHYSDDILSLWQKEQPDVAEVDIFVRPNSMPCSVTSSAPINSEPQAATHSPYQTSQNYSSNHTPNYNNRPTAEQPNNTNTGNANVYNFYTGTSSDDLAALSAPLDARFTFDNFVVGQPNELAFAAARRVAESTTCTPGCNPLFLYGGVGLGKTHLMHAIAWYIRMNQPDRRVLYLSAEKFMYQFIRALRDRNTVSFKEQFRSVDILMVDDVQFICGKESTQEEFFHTFNALVDQNRQVVISGDRSPSDMDGIEDRMRSRLGWGLVADINSTTYELRLGILQSKVENIGMEVPPKVLEFLAHKVTSNIRELEGALNRIVAHSQLVGRTITLENTHDALRDLLRSCERKVSVDDIQKKVAEHFNIKISDMHSARRSRAIARPRQVAMYLSKKLTTKSLPEIGRSFGGKDHTTVMHAVKKVEQICAEDSGFAEDVILLERMLHN